MARPTFVERTGERISDHAPMPGQEIVASAEASLRALQAGEARLHGLAAEAQELTTRVGELDRRERSVSDREEHAALQAEELAVQAEGLRTLEAELVRRERDADDLARDHSAALEALRREQRQMDETALRLDRLATELDDREHRFARRWLGLLRSWRRRPARSECQPCDLLFLPTADGYKLLPEDGVALRRGARLTLSAEGGSFVVSKIALWPFDDRWCAYLQQER